MFGIKITLSKPRYRIAPDMDFGQFWGYRALVKRWWCPWWCEVQNTHADTVDKAEARLRHALAEPSSHDAVRELGEIHDV